MSYSAVPEQVSGDAWTSAEMETYVKDNFSASPVDVVTTANDLVIASAANTPARLALGSNTQVLEAKSSETTGRRFANSGLVPVGGIVIWSGATGSIPTGWQICDGTNSTPDLRDQFIVGAGDTYAVTDTGGAASMNLQHSHTLTSPTASGGGHTHAQANTDTDGAHSHNLPATTGAQVPASYRRMWTGSDITVADEDGANHTHTISGATNSDGSHAHSNPTTGSSGAHTHTIADTSSDNQLSTTQSNLPPYYALAYIQRMS